MPTVFEVEVGSVFPNDGDNDIPLDAVIFLWVHSGQDFQVMQNEVEVLVEEEIFHIDIMGEVKLYRFEPLEDFEPETEINLWVDEEILFSFTTGTEKLEENVSEKPKFDFEYTYNLYTPSFLCDLDYIDQASFRFNFEEKSNLNLDEFILIYDKNDISEETRPLFVQQNGEIRSFEHLEEQVDRSKETCFVAQYMNMAGEMSEFSDVVCDEPTIIDQTLEWKEGSEGCSSVSSRNLSWLVLGFGLVGLLRRREGG